MMGLHYVQWRPLEPNRKEILLDKLANAAAFCIVFGSLTLAVAFAGLCIACAVYGAVRLFT